MSWFKNHGEYWEVGGLAELEWGVLKSTRLFLIHAK